MALEQFLLPYTDALRVWGFCAGVIAVPELVDYVRNKQFLKTSGWTVVLLVLILVVAGAGLPLFRLFGPPEASDVYAFSTYLIWLGLSGAGWTHAVSASKQPKLMALSGVILLTACTVGAGL